MDYENNINFSPEKKEEIDVLEEIGGQNIIRRIMNSKTEKREEKKIKNRKKEKSLTFEFKDVIFLTPSFKDKFKEVLESRYNIKKDDFDKAERRERVSYVNQVFFDMLKKFNLDEETWRQMNYKQRKEIAEKFLE